MGGPHLKKKKKKKKTQIIDEAANFRGITKRFEVFIYVWNTLTKR